MLTEWLAHLHYVCLPKDFATYTAAVWRLDLCSIYLLSMA